jgi:hypothetical protein
VDEMHRRLYKQVPHNGLSSWGFLSHFNISQMSVALQGSTESLFCVTHFVYFLLAQCINPQLSQWPPACALQ